MAGAIYIGFSDLLVKLRIDDAVDAIPVHFANGIWGCLATGLFSSANLLVRVYGPSAGDYAGWFYQVKLRASEREDRHERGEEVGSMMIYKMCSLLITSCDP